MNFNNLQKLLDSMGMNIHQLECNLGLGNGTIRKWQDGKITPNVATLMKIADFFEVEITYLLN